MAKGKRGGYNAKAGRKKNPVKRKMLRVIVPVDYYDVIKSKTKQLTDYYMAECRRKLN